MIEDKSDEFIDLKKYNKNTSYIKISVPESFPTKILLLRNYFMHNLLIFHEASEIFRVPFYSITKCSIRNML